jgi:hypothetical protein
MSEVEFNEIVERLVVAPHKPDFQNIQWAKKTHDFADWYRESHN